MANIYEIAKIASGDPVGKARLEADKAKADFEIHKQKSLSLKDSTVLLNSVGAGCVRTLYIHHL